MSEAQKISPFDVALMGALKSIIEVLAAKGVATHDEFALAFWDQMRQCLNNQDGYGAAVFQMLVQFCEQYGAAHRLHDATPGGSA